MSKNKKKTIVDYIKQDKFSKCQSFDEKSSLEIKNLISKISLDCVSKASDQGRQLKELYSILESKVHGKSIILRKSVIVSLCLVYKDILPTYKITVLSNQQKLQNMKNETIKTYSEEEILLSHYHKYIRLMESVIKRKYDIESLNHIRWTESDELTLLKCACKLFLNNPEFNYSSLLLKLIVPNLNSTNPKLLKCAVKTMESAIKDDIKLSVSLQICEAIKQYSVANKFSVRSTVLRPFIHLDLEEIKPDDVKGNNCNKRNALMSRKDKKNNKKNKKYTDQLAQISAKESVDIKYKNNSLIIRTIFYIYFRMLKRSRVPAKLLESVLQGIQKFGRLVDCQLFPDIFSIMTKISQNQKISIENRLRSVFVCLDIVTSGKASEILDIDPGNFCAILVALMNHSNLGDAAVVLIINCSTKLLVKRRNYISQPDSQKLIESLMQMAWNHKDVPYICSTILVSIVRYLRIYPQLQYIFDDADEEEDILDCTLVADHDHSQSNHPSLRRLQDLCKLSTYEIAGIAKSIKKFFVQTNMESSLYTLKGSLEELTRLKTEECLEHLKEKIRRPVKRSSNKNIDEDSDCSESAAKKSRDE